MINIMCVEPHASQLTRVSNYMCVHKLVCKKWSHVLCVELCVASTHLICSVESERVELSMRAVEGQTGRRRPAQRLLGHWRRSDDCMLVDEE